MMRLTMSEEEIHLMTDERRDGALALVGSGEYTDAMLETDAALLATLGGASAARVALLPTAAGLEANGPSYWNTLGQRHFASLGVRDIRPTLILDRASANDLAQVALLRDANFYYFSGGNPQHLIESLRGSAAWDVIARGQAAGAVLAGCSAGAMAMSGYSLSLRALLAGLITGGPGDWQPALATVPQVVVFPHFDRLPSSVSGPFVRRLAQNAPQGVALVGVDEDTALVRLEAAVAPSAQTWRVMGRQAVHIFRKDAKPQTLRAGEAITL